MSDTQRITPDRVRTLDPTMELRWEQRSMGNYSFNGQCAPPLTVLQQRWVCREDGSSEWHDIPTFLAESLRPTLAKLQEAQYSATARTQRT